MKINCGKTWAEKREAKEKWHRWFAWHPVRLGSHDCRWLEAVMRKGEFRCSFSDCYWVYEYKSI